MKSKYILVVMLYSTIISFIVSHVLSANYVKAEWNIYQSNYNNANNRTFAQLHKHYGMIFYDVELCVVKLNQHNTLNISKFIESQIVIGYTMRTECQFIENIDTINIIAKYCILLSTFCMFTTIMIILLLWIKVETKKSSIRNKINIDNNV